MAIRATETQESPWTEYAHEYSAEGWRVLPLYTVRADGTCDCYRGAGCPSPGKHPRLRQGVKEASTDGKKIDYWGSMWPESNIGLATGPDVIALDVDARHGGRERWEEFKRRFGLPRTRFAYTGGGGYHILYLTNRPFPNRVQLGGFPGIDVRGLGGYICVAPSRHASGRTYRWQDWHAPIADAPVALVEQLAPSGGKRIRMKDGAGLEGEQAARLREKVYQGEDPAAFWLGRILAEVTPGNRNLSAYKLSCRLKEQGMPYREAMEVLRAFQACCPTGDHPFTLEEALATLRSAYRTA